LGKPITLDDMAEVDMETYNSLKWVIDNDPEDLYLTFSAQEDKFGEVCFIFSTG
jgi:E3 ubiquitin-protein ligase NEDD4